MSNFAIYVHSKYSIKDDLLGPDSWKLEATIEETKTQTDYNVGPEVYVISYHLAITFGGAAAFGAFLKKIVDSFQKWRGYTKDDSMEIEVGDVKVKIRGKPDVQTALKVLRSMQRKRRIELLLAKEENSTTITPKNHKDRKVISSKKSKTVAKRALKRQPKKSERPKKRK